ncbi:MAG: PHP domain-containing protein [Kofleriaceae bacterium]|nr:PHP domain-containing protein [Kofleriaceae bacterium]MBP9169306.1 PHP domain-containing protein [Kofleriaceae bacterium]MBP9861111.1 PHP domain-containing protein [Kofleriaceae bacterium]
MRIELHCHSRWSDGTATVAEVAARLTARAPTVAALTDHDTAAGCGELAAAVPGALRACELTCVEDRRAVHVLVYDVASDERWGEFETLLAEQAAARRQRLRAIAARLFHLGVVLDVEPILARADGRVVGRPDIAAALVAQGAVADRDEAFDRWLHDGGPADVPLARLSIADGLAAVRAVGARASLAHPHQHGDRAARYLRRYRGDGLDGVEACYGRYDPGERDRWLRVADQLGLVATGGSDWHGEPAGEVAVEIPEERGKALLAWLGRG